MCTWPGAHVLVREQLVGVGPLLSPCGLRDPARASSLGGSLLPQGPSHKAQVTLVGWTPAAVSMLVRAPYFSPEALQVGVQCFVLDGGYIEIVKVFQ